MIETKIADDIWNQKYRDNNELEGEFYQRPVKGLFDGLSDDELSLYYPIVKVSTRKEFYDKMLGVFSEHKGMLAGRPMHALGTDKTDQTFSNCYVIPIKKDSMRGIFKSVEDAGMSMKAGGGVGYNFSILRPKNALIKTSGAVSSGPVSFMNIYNAVCETIKAGGNRRGAQIAVLDIWHPDIIEFVTCKRAGDGIPEKYKPYKNFNLSVYVSDAFIKAVKNDDKWDLVFPDTAHPNYNTEWDGNIDAWLEKGYTVDVYETIKARDLWDVIAKSSYDFAEPGILFKDTINKANTLWFCEYIACSNPCGEVPMIGYGSCNLAPVNLPKYITNMFTDSADFDMMSFKETVTCLVIMLDRMLDINFYPLSEQKEQVEKTRQIGLGLTGLGDMLAMLKLNYSSEKGRNFVDSIMLLYRNTAYRTSIELAKVKGSFKMWDTFTPEQKHQFVEGEFTKHLPDHMKKEIIDYGVRNSRLLSLAPVGTISLLLNNVSSGIEPIFLLEYDRKIKISNEETITETVETYSWKKYKEFVGQENPEKPDYFETTEELNVDAHLKMQGLMQKYVDASISKTINLPAEYGFGEFKDVYMKAHGLGIKGCTTYRPNKILGSVLSKKGENGISNRPDEIQPHFAPKRPKDLPCHIHQCSVKGTKYLILVGLLNETPFEMFAGEDNDLSIPSYVKDGIIKKCKNGTYSLEYNTKRTSIEIKDIAQVMMDGNQRAMTRLISLSLRHGVNMEFIIKQLKKAGTDITEFSMAVSRILGTYIKEYKHDKGELCPECGEPMVRKEGCMGCSCGYSKCG